MNPVDRVIAADTESYLAHEDLETAVAQALGYDPDLPPWKSLSVDPLDWDGTAIELGRMNKYINPTSSELEEIWTLGANVLHVTMGTEKPRRWLKDPAQCGHRDRKETG